MDSIANVLVPDCNVVFFPYKKEDTEELSSNDALDLADWAPLNVHDDIIECSTSKPKGGTGTWVLVLSSRLNYKALLHPGCWCMIYMSHQPLTGKEKAEEDSGLKMLGMVRSVRRKEVINPETGTKMIRYLVAGEDFHSVFNTQVYINVNLADLGNGQKNQVAQALLIFNKNFRSTVLSPNLVIEALVDSLLGTPALKGGDSITVSKTGSSGRTGQPFQVPPELSEIILGDSTENNLFTEMLTQFIDDNMLGTLVVTSDVSGAPTIWSILQGFAHRILNEMYTDLLPLDVGDGEVHLVPSFVYRPIPFSTSEGPSIHDSAIEFASAGGNENRGFSVPKRFGKRAGVRASGIKKKRILTVNRNGHFFVSRDVFENEIVAFDSGKTDRERFNFFFVPSNLADSNVSEIVLLTQIIAGQGLSAVGDESSILRYGLRPYIAFSNFATGDDTHVQKINALVKDLWKDAHLYESGTVTLVGSSSHIPVGTNVKFVERDWIAHVEKVDNAFVVDQTSGTKSFRTSVTFVRLQTTSGDGVDEIGAKDTSSTDVFEFDRGIASTTYKGTK